MNKNKITFITLILWYLNTDNFGKLNIKKKFILFNAELNLRKNNYFRLELRMNIKYYVLMLVGFVLLGTVYGQGGGGGGGGGGTGGGGGGGGGGGRKK